MLATLHSVLTTVSTGQVQTVLQAPHCQWRPAGDFVLISGISDCHSFEELRGVAHRSRMLVNVHTSVFESVLLQVAGRGKRTALGIQSTPPWWVVGVLLSVQPSGESPLSPCHQFMTR